MDKNELNVKELLEMKLQEKQMLTLEDLEQICGGVSLQNMDGGATTVKKAPGTKDFFYVTD